MVQFPIAPGDKKGGVLRIKSIKKPNRFDVIFQIFCVKVFLDFGILNDRNDISLTRQQFLLWHRNFNYFPGWINWASRSTSFICSCVNLSCAVNRPKDWNAPASHLSKVYVCTMKAGTAPFYQIPTKKQYFHPKPSQQLRSPPTEMLRHFQNYTPPHRSVVSSVQNWYAAAFFS